MMEWCQVNNTLTERCTHRVCCSPTENSAGFVLAWGELCWYFNLRESRVVVGGVIWWYLYQHRKTTGGEEVKVIFYNIFQFHTFITFWFLLILKLPVFIIHISHDEKPGQIPRILCTWTSLGFEVKARLEWEWVQAYIPLWLWCL